MPWPRTPEWTPKSGIWPTLPPRFLGPDPHFDLVRVGLRLAEFSPFEGQNSAELGLRPAMTVRTLVSNCKRVPEGQGVSYGLNYRTSGECALGLIPLGYADGVPRVATVRSTESTIPLWGTIAMDQMVIDLGGDGRSRLAWAPKLSCRRPDGGPTADDWAAAAGTNNYEIVTRVGPLAADLHQ